MKIQGKAVLIRPDILPERTASGILVIPKNSKEMLPSWGTVEDCGPECEVVSKGDRVNFPRKSASVIIIDGNDFYFIEEHRIFYDPDAKEAETTMEMKEYTCEHCGHVFKANVPATVCPNCY